MERDQILDALERWINQRPGLDPRNYGDGIEGWRNYRNEARRIARQLHDARTLLAAVRWRTSIGVDELKAAFKGAYSGRLTLKEGSNCVPHLDYCTGQYWPTEYRAAACAVLASALWAYTRANMPTADKESHPGGLDLYAFNGNANQQRGVSAGDWIRLTLRREFGANIQRRWMD
jgi:hypothetical protein